MKKDKKRSTRTSSHNILWFVQYFQLLIKVGPYQCHSFLPTKPTPHSLGKKPDSNRGEAQINGFKHLATPPCQWLWCSFSQSSELDPQFQHASGLFDIVNTRFWGPT